MLNKKAYNEKSLQELTSKINDTKSFWSQLKRMTNTSSRTSNTITTEEWVRHFDGLLNPLVTDEENIYMTMTSV